MNTYKYTRSIQDLNRRIAVHKYHICRYIVPCITTGKVVDWSVLPTCRTTFPALAYHLKFLWILRMFRVSRGRRHPWHILSLTSGRWRGWCYQCKCKNLATRIWLKQNLTSGVIMHFHDLRDKTTGWRRSPFVWYGWYIATCTAQAGLASDFNS